MERESDLGDPEVHDNGPSWSIFDRLEEWRSFRGQLDLHHEEGRNELVVSVDMVRVLEFDVTRHVVNPFLSTDTKREGG
jgi:hypothetical protein